MNEKDVAQELESQIREAIERMVADIRSSIDDVREVVDKQLQAALQSVQADANTTSFRTILDRALADLKPAEPAAPASAPRASRVKRSVQAIEKGRSQVEVLNALMEETLQFGSRAALLILKGDSFAGWKGIGYERFGVDDESIKRFNAAPGVVAELDRVLREEQSIDWTGDSFARRLAIEAPAMTLAVPMVIKDKIAAAMVVEVAPDDVDRFDRDAIELLVFTTGLLIDTLAIRRRIPSPSLSRAEAGSETASVPPPAPTAPPPARQAPAAPVPPPAPAVAPPPEPQPAPAAPEPPPASPAESDQRRTETGVRPITQSGSESSELADRPSTQYVPPAGIKRNFQRTAAQGEDARRQDEARRFARLLVSEIKLYNESKVDQGRKNRDLYERLKEDIDRSRQMYDERIPEDVRKSSNYFYDELVRILADGDADILGL